jgi:DNA-binding HxlR family transcriptional regulator
MTPDRRSGCPINLALETFGDRWSLIILRDIMFGNRRHFRDLLTLSDEGISSSILAERLKMLVDQGMITNIADPSHKQKTIYSLTEKSIALVPVFAILGEWGLGHLPVTEPFGIRARLLADGGPELWSRFMAELRAMHIDHPQTKIDGSVLRHLTEAYLAQATVSR